MLQRQRKQTETDLAYASAADWTLTAESWLRTGKALASLTLSPPPSQATYQSGASKAGCWVATPQEKEQANKDRGGRGESGGREREREKNKNKEGGWGWTQLFFCLCDSRVLTTWQKKQHCFLILSGVQGKEQQKKGRIETAVRHKQNW